MKLPLSQVKILSMEYWEWSMQIQERHDEKG